MSVGYVRPEVTQQLSKWTLIRDCLAGQEAVKAKRELYLPKPNASDRSPENETRYQQYLARAVFYGVTKRTLDGLVGQVFARDPVVEIPDAMDPLLVDIDGAGVALDQQAKKALAMTLALGRCGLLVDYPPTKGAATRADLEAGYIRPTITLYEPDAVINWRTVTVGARRLFSLVVISELALIDDDGFEAQTEQQYRVLRLVPPAPPDSAPEDWQPDYAQASYQVEIWRVAEQEGQSTGWSIIDRYQPTDAQNRPWREIPFTFVGALNNDPLVDHPPLYDLAVLNIAHYRNSADHEEACYLVGQPTPYVAGLTQEWVDANFKDQKVMIGSRALLPLPVGGTAGLLQASPNTLPGEAMTNKERQMVALGAKLVEPRQVQRTATEAQQDSASESSILASVTKNVSRGYTDGLRWCAEYTGATFSEAPPPNADGESAPQEISYQLNADFPAARMAPDELTALVAAWQAGAVADSEMRDRLRAAGYADLDDDEWKEEQDTKKPLITPDILARGMSAAAGAKKPAAEGMDGGDGQGAGDGMMAGT